jgi:hypothetical protein
VGPCKWSNTCWRGSLGTRGGEHSGDGIVYEVKVTDFLCDDLKTWAGAECLYLWAEDLAKGHILEVEWGPGGGGCADLGSPGGEHRKIVRQPPR